MGTTEVTNPVTATAIRVVQARAAHEMAGKAFMRALRTPGVDPDYLWKCEKAMSLAFADQQDAMLAHELAKSRVG